MNEPVERSEGDEGSPEETGNDNLPAPDEVGYGKPPAQHQFKKGQSGNPKGRPRGSRNKVPKGQGFEFGKQPANQMLLEEAYRTIAIREGEKVIELPVIKAVFRSLGVSALKGNRLAQATMAELVRGVEEEDRQLRTSLFETACEYKWKWEGEIEQARQHGLPEPTPLPHPDDVIINARTGEVTIEGPMDEREKAHFEEMITRREAAQEEVNYCAEKARRAKSDKMKTIWLEDWHFGQRMFDIINDGLPKRYKAKLENRSYRPGASIEGKTLKEFAESRKRKKGKRKRDD